MNTGKRNLRNVEDVTVRRDNGFKVLLLPMVASLASFVLRKQAAATKQKKKRPIS